MCIRDSYNLGNLTAGTPLFIPCTPKGIMRFFEYYNLDISGKHVVVVGRSNIVGRPVSILTSLKNKYSNATTTICHSGTSDIFKFTKMADVIILALGSFTSFPKNSKSFSYLILLPKKSLKVARILEVSDISLLSNLTPDDFENDLIIGSNEAVAKAGASSVLVYIIFDINNLLNS